jgi:phage-related protein
MAQDKVVFYIDSRGNAPVYDYIASLGKRKGKDSRVKYNKINEYILSEEGA